MSGSLDPLLDTVADELNVKTVEVAGSAEAFGRWRAKPDFKVLGPRLGRRVQAVAVALGGDDGSLAGRLADGETVPVTCSSPATCEQAWVWPPRAA
jgi:isoleucyl-tRNA synthetase